MSIIAKRKYLQAENHTSIIKPTVRNVLLKEISNGNKTIETKEKYTIETIMLRKNLKNIAETLIEVIARMVEGKNGNKRIKRR